jgi:hypothetical protein
MNVRWVKCGDDGHWCSLQHLNLGNITTFGVYIIWHEGNPARVVRIGQGDIADRLGCHRRDSDILAYAQFGTLRVTWAAVPEAQVDGVERYLADAWQPLVGDAFPDCRSIEVNSPFA